MEQPSYYAIIPAVVRYNKSLKANEKLLYGEITALANKRGYCNASNAYFAELYDTTPETVSRWISNLVKQGCLKREEITDGKQIIERRLFVCEIGVLGIDEKINTPMTKTSRGIDENVKGGIDENVKENNTRLNNINIGQRNDDFVVLSDNPHDENLSQCEDTPKTEKPKKLADKEITQKQFLKIVEVFNRVFEGSAVRTVNLKATKSNEKRVKLIPAAWKIAKERISTKWVDENGLIDGEKPSGKHVLEWFEMYFESCLEDPFINGTAGRRNGHENWKADFDYLLKTQILEKRVYEGN